MVCPTAILSASLALSLLRHSSLPSESFVLSPFSLNTALSIVHDGANGITQQELTNLLLNGCSPSDVSDFYSNLTLSLPTAKGTGVTFNSANRFYVDDSISLNNDYKKYIEDKYAVKVENTKLSNKEHAAKEINNFVEGATNGKIKDVITPDGISDDAVTILVNGIYFLGTWKLPFNSMSTRNQTFHGMNEDRMIEFMSKYGKYFRASLTNDIGTVLILPYQDVKYRFFYLMPKESSNLEKLRNELTGEKLISLVKGATDTTLDIIVPKFKVESKLDGVDVLSQLGVKQLFKKYADLSKISPTRLKVSQIMHNAVIEIDEEGTEAAASTFIESTHYSARPDPPVIVINRPFLFGILRNDDIIFTGQFA